MKGIHFAALHAVFSGFADLCVAQATFPVRQSRFGIGRAPHGDDAKHRHDMAARRLLSGTPAVADAAPVIASAASSSFAVKNQRSVMTRITAHSPCARSGFLLPF